MSCFAIPYLAIAVLSFFVVSFAVWQCAGWVLKSWKKKWRKQPVSLETRKYMKTNWKPAVEYERQPTTSWWTKNTNKPPKANILIFAPASTKLEHFCFFLWDVARENTTGAILIFIFIHTTEYYVAVMDHSIGSIKVLKVFDSLLICEKYYTLSRATLSCELGAATHTRCEGDGGKTSFVTSPRKDVSRTRGGKVEQCSGSTLLCWVTTARSRIQIHLVASTRTHLRQTTRVIPRD